MLKFWEWTVYAYPVVHPCYIDQVKEWLSAPARLISAVEVKLFRQAVLSTPEEQVTSASVYTTKVSTPHIVIPDDRTKELKHSGKSKVKSKGGM